MATVRMTEAELARDIGAVLDRVKQGVEVIVKHDHQPVAVIRAPQGPGRKIGECIALAKAYEEKLDYGPVPYPDSRKMCKRLSRRTEGRCTRLHGISPGHRRAHRRRARRAARAALGRTYLTCHTSAAGAIRPLE